MKKTIKFLTMFVASLMLMPAFVSCDKDDDKEGPSVVASVLGTYTGSLAYSVMGYDPGDIEGEYELKIIKDANEADEVNVILPECSFTPPFPQASAYTIPSLTISDVDVSEKGNTYTISEDNFDINVNGTTYSGKLRGTIVGKKAEIEYVVRPGRMPMDINFTFTGILK